MIIRKLIAAMVLMVLVLPPVFSQYQFEWVLPITADLTISLEDIVVDRYQNTYSKLSFRNYAVLAGDTVYSNGTNRSCVIKVDDGGNILWYHCPDYSIIDMAIAQNGDIVWAASFSDTLQIGANTLISDGEASALLLKTNQNLQPIWYKVVQPAAIDESVGIRSIALDAYDNIYYTAVKGGNDCCIFVDDLLVEPRTGTFLGKFDTGGNAIWVKSYIEFTDDGPASGKIFVDDKNDIFLRAYFHSSVKGLIFQLDSLGNVLWEASYIPSDENFTFGTAVGLGSFWVKGQDAGSWISVNDTITITGPPPVLLKYDNETGALDWYRFIPLEADFPRLHDLGFTKTGKIVFAIPLDDEPTKLVQYDTLGNITDTTDLYDGRYQGLSVKDNSLFLSGWYTSNQNFPEELALQGNFDLFLLKLSEPCNLSLINPIADETLSICSDTAVEISAYDQGCALEYEWSTGAQSSSIIVESGTQAVFTLTVRDSLGNSTSDSVEVEIHPPLEFTLGEDQIQCQGTESLILQPSGNFESYFWSTGATDASIEITESGTYWVTVTNENGCQATDTLNVNLEVCTGLPDITTSSFKIYPNPHQGSFTLTTPSSLSINRLRIADLSGRTAWVIEEHFLPTGSHEFRAPLSAGMYILWIETPHRTYQMRMLVR